MNNLVFFSFLTDALGSVRQMTDQAGGITFARNYDPYGVVTYTGGTSQTEYGFTGEQYGESTQLVYLWARYYNPADGRFQSRDTWGGDYNRPLSLNRWGYVEGNPVNLVDPSGLKPCQKRQTGGERYCILDSGGFLDLAHFWEGEIKASEILNGLVQRIGKDGAEFQVSQPLVWIIPFTQTYKTFLPEGISEEKLKSIALGIFMDFEIQYELFQALDPRCAPEVYNPSCSSFSNEDLISDYLGFSMHMKKISFERVIIELGGGESSSTKPGGFHPKNYHFTSFNFVEENCGNVKIVQRHLPPALLLGLPTESGQYWKVPVFGINLDLEPWL